MANQMISIKIEGEEEQILQFSIPDSDTFNSSVNGFLDDHNQYAGTEEIASLLGNPSSESLTMYKCEPMEQEDEIQQSVAPEGSQGYYTAVATYSDVVGVSDKITNGTGGTSAKSNSKEVNGTENMESSSSSSNSDDEDNSSASDGDNDSSAEEESRNGMTDSDSRELTSRRNPNQRQDGNERIAQVLRRKRIKSKSDALEPENNVQLEMEKTLENFVQDNIEDYLKRHGFRDGLTVPATVSKGTFASTILPEAAKLNTVAYGPQYDVHEVSEEIERLWEFYLKLKENFPQYAVELKPIFTVTLLHFFQEFFNKGLPKFAIKLYTSFAKRFYQEDRSQDTLNILSNLSGIVNTGTLKSSEYLENIQHHDYHFLFSEVLFQKLHQFLIGRQSPVLVHLFTSKFVIQLKETAEVIDSLLEDEGVSTEETNEALESVSTKIGVAYSMAPEMLNPVDPVITPKRVPVPHEFQGVSFDKEERMTECKITDQNIPVSPARKAIYQLRNSVESNIPSIHLYTLSERPVSASISPQGTMFAFGMSTSVINVCFSTRRELDRFNIERKLRKSALSKSAHRNVKSKRRKRNYIEIDSKNPIDKVNSIIGESSGYSPAHPTGDSDQEAEDRSVKSASMINSMFGHEGPVYDLKFHPRAQVLFSVGHDSTLRAWDLKTFKCRCVYRGHTSPIWCMDITDTGHMIVTGSMDTSARIWLTEKTEFVRLLAGHYFDVDCVKFHPNEAYVATGSLDKSVRLWSIADGNLVRVFTGATSGLSAIAFHQSGKYIIGGGEDSFIRIWDIAEGETLAELPSPMGSASSCRRLTVYQNMLAAGFEDNSVRIWNLRELFGGNKMCGLVVSESSSSSSDTEDELHLLPPKLETSAVIPNPSTSEAPEQPEAIPDNGESDTASSCSITEDELEPLETSVPSTAVRLPAPKIIPCASSALLTLHYQDFQNLIILGSKVENIEVRSAPAPEPETKMPESAPPISATVHSPMQQETEPGIVYLPEFMRPTLISAGISRWPIPVEKLTSSEDEEETGDTAPKTK